VDATEPWFDGRYPTDPKGLRARDLGLAGILGGPFRRVIEANFLQPVIEIRQPPGSWRLDNAHITPLVLDEKEPRLFVGEFTAGGSGELFVFANDAVALHDPTYFYTSPLGKNSGKALIWIWNAFGTIDLVDALALGVISTNGSPLQVIHAGVGSQAMQMLPWSLLPTVLVPMLLIVHGVIFFRLARATAPAAS